MRSFRRFFLLGIVLIGCSHAPIMQDAGFQGIVIGAPIQELTVVYGEPYEVCDLSNGMQEWRYVQRIDCGTTAVEQTDFIFIVCQGRIVSKHRQQHSGCTLQIGQ